MKKTKKLLSVILSLVILLNAAIVTAVPVQASTELGSYIGDARYETIDFSLEKTTTVRITFDSSVETTFALRYKDFDGYYYSDKFRENNVTTLSKTLNLDEGQYRIELSPKITPGETECSLLVEDVTVDATDLKFKTSSKECSVGDMFALLPTFSPAGSIPRSVKYTSSNPKVARVSEFGAVLAMSLGKCTITAQLDNGKKTTCNVIVKSRSEYIYKDSTKKAPPINGKAKGSWKSSKPAVASVNKQTFKGVKQGVAKYTTTVSKTKYTYNVYVVDYNTFYKKALNVYKDALKDPDSLKIYHVYRGYDTSGRPTIVLDSGAKNSYGGMVRSYCNLYVKYDTKAKKYVYNYYDTKSKIKLLSEKKIK